MPSWSSMANPATSPDKASPTIPKRVYALTFRKEPNDA
jgi:hypothetical protein